jgi:anti-sigma-K factor RskA
MSSPEEDEMLELTAGELTAAMTTRRLEALPTDLAARLVRDGEQVLRQSAPRAVSPVRRIPWGALSGWMAAAGLALWLVTSRPTPSPTVVARTPVTLRDSLLRESTGLVQVGWTPTADSTAIGATGDLVWHPATQRGVMRFRGLASNTPTQFQYQLWVFDATRDERFPVDGGVFDIPAGASVVEVPIDVRVPVGAATLFAITVERPGGVVVSTRERIALTAKVGA